MIRWCSEGGKKKTNDYDIIEGFVVKLHMTNPTLSF